MAHLLDRNKLKSLADLLHQLNKKIVATNGTFDIFHAGDVHLLGNAKSLGDALIVGINSDSSVKKNKGDDRPVISQDLRAMVISSIVYVDYLHIFDEESPIEFLEAVRPDVYVNNIDYGENCVEAQTVGKYGGRLVLLEKVPELLSESQIIDKIVKVYGNK